MKKSIAVFLVIALVVSLSLGGSGAYAKSLDEINNDLDSQQSQLKKGEAQEDALSAELKNIYTNIKSTVAEIDEAQAELDKIEKGMDIQTDELGQRLRNMYKSGSVGYVDVLLGSTSVYDFISNVDMVQRIYKSDKDMLQAMQENYKSISAQKKKLKQLQAELAEAKAAAAAKKSKVAAKNEQTRQQIEALNAAKSEIVNEIKKDTTGKKVKYSGGQFAWPVPGHTSISSGYGPRWGTFHYGIDIPAPSGATVVAAASGTVIYAGWKNSFGNVVMISHGSSLYTLYAHNSSIAVSSGQSVSKGQKISGVGTTGDSTGNHCHFEVYKGGTAWGVNQVNPLNYL